MKNTRLSIQLTQKQLEHFHREGYLVAKGVIPGDYVYNLLDEIDEAIDQQANKLHADGKIDELHQDLDILHRATRLFEQSSLILAPVYSGNHSGEAIFRLITCPEILEIMEQLIGPEIIASGIYRLRPKLPFQPEGEVPWHQDSGYFHSCADEHLVATCWVPLMNATVEAGCMEVLPRSHKGGVFRHFRADIKAPSLAIHPDHLPEVEPVAVPADIGDAVLMMNLTPHRSIPNRSGLIRWAADLRYNAPEAGNYGPGEAGFLARSKVSPSQVVTDWEQFDLMRKNHVPEGKADRNWLKQAEETFEKPPHLSF